MLNSGRLGGGFAWWKAMGDTIVEESHSRETYDNVELESSATVNSVDGAAINNDDECDMENAVSIELSPNTRACF